MRTPKGKRGRGLMHRPMAASYAMLDRIDEARVAILELKLRAPKVSAEPTRSFPFKNNDAVAHFVEAMRKAEAPA